MSKLKYIFASVAILMLCICSLAIPTFVAMGQDIKLLSRPFPREQAEDLISEKARKIPIVYALHKRKNMEARYGQEEIELSEKIVAQLNNTLTQLEQFKVLTHEQIQEINQILQHEQASIYCRKDIAGFIEIGVSVFKSNYASEQIYIVIHEKTGKVSQFYYSTDTKLQSSLQEWKQYLGLGEIDDFTQIKKTNAECSKTAQLYLHCTQNEKNQISFSATAMNNSDAAK